MQFPFLSIWLNLKNLVLKLVNDSVILNKSFSIRDLKKGNTGQDKTTHFKISLTGIIFNTFIHHNHFLGLWQSISITWSNIKWNCCPKGLLFFIAFSVSYHVGISVQTKKCTYLCAPFFPLLSIMVLPKCLQNSVSFK